MLTHTITTCTYSLGKSRKLHPYHGIDLRRRLHASRPACMYSTSTFTSTSTSHVHIPMGMTLALQIAKNFEMMFG